MALLESLLELDLSIEIKQDKWLKKLGEGLINIKEQGYSLKVTSNKRHLIYEEGKLWLLAKPSNKTFYY